MSVQQEENKETVTPPPSQVEVERPLVMGRRDDQFLVPGSILFNKIGSTATRRSEKVDITSLDYKNPSALKPFLSPGGRILPKIVTGLSRKAQNQLESAVKHCRHLAIFAAKEDTKTTING